jgi:hypothetical protein
MGLLKSSRERFPVTRGQRGAHGASLQEDPGFNRGPLLGSRRVQEGRGCHAQCAGEPGERTHAKRTPPSLEVLDEPGSDSSPDAQRLDIET